MLTVKVTEADSYYQLFVYQNFN